MGLEFVQWLARGRPPSRTSEADDKELIMSIETETFREQIRQGIPRGIPDPSRIDPWADRAPARRAMEDEPRMKITLDDAGLAD